MNHSWGEDRILTFLKEGRDLHKAIIEKNSEIKIPPPRFVSCWISEVCNLDCTYCFFSETNHDKSHQFIDTSAFNRWLGEARNAGVESLEFSGGGEPTLHKDFYWIIQRGRELGLQMGLITHGCNEMLHEMIAKTMRYVRIGLDAATPETHDLIKQNKKKDFWFHQAIENIKELVRQRDIRESRRRNTFAVGIKVVLNAINYHELEAICRLGKELNVDYVQFKREHSSQNDLTQDQIYKAQNMLHDIGKLYLSRRIKITGTMIHQAAVVKCFMAPIHTVVTATGKILNCCFFEKHPIGSIQQPFGEVWGSEKHRSVIESFSVEDCNKVDCRWNYYNRRMAEIISDPLAEVSFI